MTKVDVTLDALLLLRAIEQTRGRFGLCVPIEVLLGRRTARLKKLDFESLPTYGTGKHQTEQYWKTMARGLQQDVYIDVRGAGKGFGKANQMAIYAVSSLGKQVLEKADAAGMSGGEAPCIMVDMHAEAASFEAEVAARQARRRSSGGKSGGRRCSKLPAASPQALAPAESSHDDADADAEEAEADDDGAAGTELAGKAGSAGAVDFDAGFSTPEPPAKRARRRLPPTLVASSGAREEAAVPTPAPVPAASATSSLGASKPPSRAANKGGGSTAKSGGMNAGPSRADDGLRPAPNPGTIQAESPLPAALDAALMPFQRAGVAFAVRRQGRVLIGDDMGLGKTIQAIATCCAFRADWPALVVVPNSVRLVWADELERWVSDLGPWGVNVVRNGQDLLGLKGNASFHIITYGLLARGSNVRDYLRTRDPPFRTLVVDESHLIKNRTATRTREVLQVARNATRVILLSGTPALARPVEIYTQVDTVEPGLLGSFSSFAERYCAPKWTPFGMDFSGAANVEELHGILRPVMVRRLKADVLTELPDGSMW